MYTPVQDSFAYRIGLVVCLFVHPSLNPVCQPATLPQIRTQPLAYLMRRLHSCRQRQYKIRLRKELDCPVRVNPIQKYQSANPRQN